MQIDARRYGREVRVEKERQAHQFAANIGTIDVFDGRYDANLAKRRFQNLPKPGGDDQRHLCAGTNEQWQIAAELEEVAERFIAIDKDGFAGEVFPLPVGHVMQAEMQRRIVGLKPVFEIGESLAHAFEQEIQGAASPKRFVEIGLQRDRPIVSVECLREPPQILQRVGAIVVDHGQDRV